MLKAGLDLRQLTQKHPVIFFDGVCGLCNKSIDILMHIDKQHILRFTPIQGQAAAQLLSTEQRLAINTLYVAYQNKIYDKSDALLFLISMIGGYWQLLNCLKWVPKYIRDTLYEYIASHRYRWFGKLSHCRIPAPHERHLFLD